MTDKYEIVVFSDDWHGLPFSCKHLLQHFLPEIPLIWVETIGLRSPKFTLYDIKRSLAKIKGWMTQANNNQDTLPDNLSIIDPFQIPYNQYSLVRKFNMSTMIKAVGKKRPGYKRVVLTTWPFMADIIGRLDEDLSIYYRVDDFAEFPGVNKKNICKLENNLIDRVDMVVATAEKLTQVGKTPESIKLMPHGVDFIHFSSPEKKNKTDDLLKDYSGIRIGFFGLLNSWLDFDFIKGIAVQNPEWSVIIIGPSQLAESELPSAANLHFLGPVPYSRLPEYANAFDAGLIPFKINELTLAVNPLKLMEYFALGLPVISTPLPEVMKYKEFVYITENATQASIAIKEALRKDDAGIRGKRQQLAKERSWPAKSAELRQWIESALEKEV